MACILQPKYNFLHGFFWCHLPVETVDVEVQTTSMQGSHMFRRDRMCQIIKCNPWSTRLCPHPTLIKKMRTYLKLEGKLGPKFQPQSDQSRPIQPNTNPHVRKEIRATYKRRTLIPTKRYKVQVVAKPESAPKTSNATMQPPITVPSPPINSEKPNPPEESTSDSNPPPLKNIPAHAGTPWSKAGNMSGNLFELRKDWPIPPASISNLPIKIEPQPQELATPNAATALKAKKCGWGLNCPICKNIEEDRDSDHQKQIQQGIPSTQAQNAQQPQKWNLQQPQMHSNFRCQFPASPAQKLSKTTRSTVLPVTNIWCTRQIFRPNKAP